MFTEAHAPIDGAALGTLVTSLQGTGSLDALRATCVKYFTGLGVKMMSYHHLPPLGASDYDAHIPVFAHGFPPAWVARYVDEELYTVDPIARHAADAARPFRWSSASTFDDLSSGERHYLAQLKGAELGDGLAIPVFGPHGRNGYVGLAFGTAVLPVNEEQIGLLGCMAQLGHLTCCELLRIKPREKIHLAPREREVLRLAACGKSNTVIADTLTLSRHTVDTHIRRAFGKLDASDRVTAVLRALSLGLI